MSQAAPEFDFEVVYGALPVAVALLENGRVVRTNPAMSQLFCSTSERLQGRSAWEFVADAVAREKLRTRYEARLRGEPVAPSYEMELARDDGTRFRVECQARALPDQRTVVVFRELAADAPLVAALSEAAARVQRAHTPEAVIESASHALLALGLRPYFARINGATFELIRPPGEDRAFEAFNRFMGARPPSAGSPGVRHLEAAASYPLRAQHFDDFPAVVCAYLEQIGAAAPEVIAPLRHPSHARAIVAPLTVEGRLWGTVTVVAEWLRHADLGAVALFAAQVASALEVSTALQTLQQTNRQLAAVHAVAEAGAESELSRLLPRLLAIAAESTEGDCAALWMVEDEELVLAGAYQWPGVRLGEERLPLGPGSRTGKGLAAGRATAVDLLREDGPAHCKSGQKHLAIFPLRHQGRTVGALNVGRKLDRPFSPAELEGGELIANQVVIQIEKTRLIESERRRVQHLQLLHEVSQVITASLDPEEILEAAASSMARMIDASDGFIWLYEPLTRELRGAATSTPEYREHFRGVCMQIDAAPTAAAQAMVTHAPVRITDAAQSNVINPELNRAYRVKSLLALPLLLRDQPIGAVSIGDRYRTRSWTDAEVGRVGVVASQVAVAVANARLFEDLKRSYDKLAQTREELVKRERLAALGELSAVVAHEVRNPLGVIFNSLGSLRKAVRGNADAEMLLGIVGEESDRLNRIVSDLLDFARPHEASLRLEPLEAVLQSAREASLALTGGSVGIAIEAAATLPRIAQDARMLRQALINLLVNAVQASPRGTQVVLRAAVEEHAVRVEVVDAGKGIPAAHRPRIFQPFFTTKATGTGLGLAVVKRIVEAHRGEVAMSSVEGRGTTFTLRLPLPLEPVVRSAPVA